jgi:hypothetical protein
MNQIVLPEKLQKKMIKIALEMGHFGKTKTKQMIRSKYWFPTMNMIIDQLIAGCFEYHVATKHAAYRRTDQANGYSTETLGGDRH